MIRTISFSIILVSAIVAENIDVVIEEIDFAMQGEGESQWETEKRSREIIALLEKHLPEDTVKIGMALLDAYSLGYMYFNYLAGHYKSKGIDSIEYYESKAMECKTSQQNLFGSMVASKKGSLDSLIEKYEMRSISVKNETKAILADYMLNNKNKTVGDTMRYLHLYCDDKERVANLCDNFFKRPVEKNEIGIFGVCVDCLNRYVADEIMLSYLKKYRDAIVQRGLVYPDDDYFDEVVVKQDYGEQIQMLDYKIKQKERLVRLKKEKMEKLK